MDKELKEYLKNASIFADANEKQMIKDLLDIIKKYEGVDKNGN